MPIPSHAANARTGETRGGRMVRDSIPDATDSEVRAALAAVDQDAIFDEERALFTTVVWDRKSPINGVPAEHFLSREDVPAEGDIYLLMVGDRVSVFQPHEPDEPGVVRIPRGQGRIRGERHADHFAAGRTQTRVNQALVEHVSRGRQEPKV